MVFVAFFPPPRPRIQRRSREDALSTPDSSSDPSASTTGPLPRDLIKLLPEVVALVESTPQLLTIPADLCRVAAALIRLLGGPTGSWAQAQPAVAMMLHRRPSLLTQRQQRPHRGRDIPEEATPLIHYRMGLHAVPDSEIGASLPMEDVSGTLDSCGYLRGFESIIQVLQVRPRYEQIGLPQ